MMRSLLAPSLLLGGCTATVAAGPARPEPPPPPPSSTVVVQPAQPPPAHHPAQWDEKRAIHEIKQAAIDDGKDITVHEPVDRPT